MIFNCLNYYKSNQKGIEIFHTKESTISYPQHNHISVYILGIVLSGKISFKRNDKTVTLSQKDVFIISPYEVHSITTECKYDLVTICIDKVYIQNGIANDLKSAIFELLKKLHFENQMSEIEISILINAIDMLYNEKNQSCFTNFNNLELAKAYIQKHSEEKIPLNKMSELTYFSKYYMINEFKNFVGLTPHRFQIQNRIRKAQRLLEQNYSITEVALVTGFFDQSHFNKSFKSILGITPSDYKNACVNLKMY